MSEGHFDKHLNRMRKIYREKHDVMLSELQKYPEKVKVHGDYAGLYVIVEVLTGKKEEQMIWEAEKRNLSAAVISVLQERRRGRKTCVFTWVCST